MTTWCRKAVLALALAVIPLQGASAAFNMLACLNGEDAHAVHANDDGDQPAGHDHGMQHPGGGDDGATGSHADSFCCHHFVPVLPLAAFATVTAKFSAQAHVPQLLHDLFLPDRPQRPPLA